MEHLGDITQITGDTIAPVNVIIGGSPCQDLSIAGKRAGLAGERSGLFTEQIRIVKEMCKKHGTDYPRFMVWENVPGALSSNKGEDFRIVLEETARIAEADAVIPRPPKGKWKNSGCIMGDGWSVAWRIFDAQFWGVPQRRRRIALVADFGGESAPEILFERKGVPGDFEKSRKEKKGATGNAEKCPDQAVYDARGNGGGMIAPTLTGDHQIVMSVHQNGDGEVRTGEIANTLNTNSNASGRNAPVIFENNGYSGYRQGVGTLKSSGGDCGGGSENLCVFCLTGWDRQARRVYSDQGIMPALSAQEVSGQNQQAILTKGTVAGFNGHKSITGSIQYREDVAPTLESNMPSNILKEMFVRRLTPLECERLQGFPDGWTDIGDYIDSKGKKKHTADTARYRALGNSIALPPWRWVLKRLCNQYDRCVTMGSLFDGIGGFPLIWEEINGKGSCLWASEIEEFPIAVTKIRIGG